MMRKTKKKLTIALAVCTLILLASTAVAWTEIEQFNFPTAVTATISGVNLISVQPPGLEPRFNVHSAVIAGGYLEIDFDVNFTAPGQYIVVEFLVFNPTNRSLSVTNVISTHAAANPYGVVVSLGGPMSALGANVVGAFAYGSIIMTIEWDESKIDWQQQANGHKISGTFEFSTEIYFDKEEQDQTPTPPNPPNPPDCDYSTNTPTPPYTPSDTPPAPDLTPEQEQNEDPPLIDEPEEGGDYQDILADDDGDHNYDYDDDDYDGIGTGIDILPGDPPPYTNGGLPPNVNGENPQTGDNFSRLWFAVSLAAFVTALAALVIVVVFGRKKNDVGDVADDVQNS